MVGNRWVRMLGPGVVVMGALGAIGASAAVGAGAGPWSPTECGGGGQARIGAASVPAPRSMIDVGGAPWFRLDPVIDGRGTLTARRLTIGINRARLDRTMTLPNESFAAGPFGGLVLAGSDDGTVSRLVALDVARACASPIVESADVIRGATIDPDRQAIYEHHVDRVSRSDLGVWRRSLDGTAGSVRVLEPLAPDDRFGRTWTTTLAWSADGARLVVQSCGASACRTRLLDRVTGRTDSVSDPTLGPLVGIDGDRLVTHLACRGLPCPLVSVDLATGRSITLETFGGSAVLVGPPGASRVVVEVLHGDEPRLRHVSIDGRDGRDLGPLSGGRRLGGDPGFAGLGLRLPVDRVLLAPDGRLPDTAARAQTTVLSLIDGQSAPFDEVTR